MDLSHQCQALSTAFSGIGIDEKALISILGKWQPDHKTTFRKAASTFFHEDERRFEKWDEDVVALLKHEFLRFKSAVVLWTMHPWERDARLVKEAIIKGPEGAGLIIEIACTRSSEELLGARKAYHSLFDHSMEEDVASHFNGHERKLLVALVSSYRYEGKHVHDDAAKSDAKTLHDAIGHADKKPLLGVDEVAMILSTRSKLHLKALCKHYQDLCAKPLDEDLHDELSLKTAVRCLCAPEIYFSEALDAALRKGADEFTQEALTRMVVSQADVNMKQIKSEYHKNYNVHLEEKIEENVRGNFRDFLLTLLARD